MGVGCGIRIRRFAGRRYLYFWHYERSGGRSVRREEYVGPAGLERARREAMRRVAAHFRRLHRDMARRKARIERAIARA